MFVATLLTQALFAVAALAAPSTNARLAARVARRGAGIRNSAPVNILNEKAVAVAGNVSHISYSSNWAGAVLAQPSGTYRSVTGTFTIPTPSRPSGASSGTYYAAAWVGIDGNTCPSAIWQAGLDFTISSSGVSYDAWYEWYPDYSYDFSGITVKAGDSVTITVTATSTKAGTTVIKNNTTGKSVSKSITSTVALCEQNAEWIVEDFESGDSQVPFANFGTVTFTNALATTTSGSTVGPSGATIMDIEQGGDVLTSVSTSSSSVTVKYV